MLRLLKALYDAGVTIIPGTDALAGYTLHHELELYVRAGYRTDRGAAHATLTPALVMGVNKDRGAIAGGKLADMVLIDGDPTQNIRRHQTRSPRWSRRQSLRSGCNREIARYHSALKLGNRDKLNRETSKFSGPRLVRATPPALKPGSC